jgi:Zn2+/Cd2+-exporting ATPase
VEAADIVLMDDDPRRLSLAIHITRRMLKIARKRIVFTLVIKDAVLALAGVGLANMWMAVFADARVSMIAILNATRTRRRNLSRLYHNFPKGRHSDDHML